MHIYNLFLVIACQFADNLYSIFYYSQMSCYCAGNQMIRFCVCCQKNPCNSNSNKNQAQIQQKQTNSIIKDIEQNFAQLLEKQLRNLSERKQEEIWELQESVYKLKTEVMRLENRNKLDRESESRLKDEVKRLNYRIKQLEETLNRPAKVERKIQIVQQIKTVAVPPKIVTQPIQNPEFDELKDKYIKLTAQKLTLEQVNKNLDDKLKKLSSDYERIINDLSQRINDLESEVRRKNEQLIIIQNQTTQLQQKYDILSRPSRFQSDPIIIHKVTTLPAEVRTIYVDRPVEKMKIVEVQKVVTKFVEPERPIVNRIIQCGSSRNFRCDSPSSSKQSNFQVQALNEKMQNLEQDYKNVITNYKGQRQKLVKVIQNRDSDYRLLQKKLELIEKINSNQNTRKCNHPDLVQVTVVKHNDRQGSEPDQPKKTSTKEPVRNPTRTEQKTRKK